MTEADHLLEGRLRIFGRLETVTLGSGLINWDFHPEDDRRAAPFRSDPKFPWEVARHAVLPRLGVAWNVSRDLRYAERAAGIVLEWSNRETAAKGLHWSEALEVGIRLIAWCQAFHFFRSSAPFKGPAMDGLLRHIAAMSAWLDGHLSTDRVVAGNHLLGELAGLVVSDLYFPEMDESERLARNLVRFTAEVRRQVAPDGVSLEQSSTYGRFIGDFIVAVLAAAAARGIAVPPALKARAGALAGWLAALTREDGSLPLTGDNDSGKGVDWGEPYPSHDARGVILSLATLVDSPAALAPFSGRGLPPGTETVFWWTGEEGVRRLDQLLKSAPAPKTLSHFPAGGHAVIRAPAEGGADFIHVRCGPFGHGLPKPSAHSHADWMSPVVSLAGTPVLIDPGNFGYTTVGDARDRFRIDESHNLFRVGDRPLAVPGEAVRWRDIPKNGRLQVEETGEEIRITGRWNPVALPGQKPVVCQRTVVYNKLQRLVSIDDEWSSDPSESLQPAVWYWHFPPETVITLFENGEGFETALPGGEVFAFELNPPAFVRLEDGWFAPVYSECLPAPVVIVERSASTEPVGRQGLRFWRVSRSGD